MSSGILGLGTSGSTDLSSELITKLKTAETTSILDPITEEKDDTQTELDALSEIEDKITELLELVENFDLYTTETNIFNSVSASTSGTSVSFDATDTDNLDTGTITVNISQLAQKDVYQSNTISDLSSTMANGTITISLADNSFTFSTDGKTYDELVEEMSEYDDLDVNLEQVSDNSYRIVIKSANSGESNALSIVQSGIDLGLNDEDNHVLSAQNMKATIDGIDYEMSSNKITLDSGLIIKATSTGESSITIERDDSSILSNIQDIATKYNELVELIDSYIIGDEENPAIISDSGTLKTVMSDIKSILFGNYGIKNEESIFNYGFTFDSDGYIQIDESTLSSAITNNFDDLKELFVGYAEKEGIGTRLKTYLDSLDSLNGILTSYEDKLNNRIDTLEEDYQTASDKLDEKYKQMSSQFAEYTVLITQMENSFASLKLIIEGDSSS